MQGAGGHGLANAHFANELAAKGVDDAGNGGRLALADEVEVQHALYRTCLEAAASLSALHSPSPLACLVLHSLDEASCLGVEQVMLWLRAQRPARRGESLNVVVGVGCLQAVGGAIGGAVGRE